VFYAVFLAVLAHGWRIPRLNGPYDETVLPGDRQNRYSRYRRYNRHSLTGFASSAVLWLVLRATAVFPQVG
jgi:hypothetical protein